MLFGWMAEREKECIESNCDTNKVEWMIAKEDCTNHEDLNM